MPGSSRQERRREAFAALLEADGYKPEDYDKDVEEDPRPYLAGTEEIGRYVCVTRNWSHSDGQLFYLPTFARLRDAQRRAEYYQADDIFEEVPIKVVDLETGKVWRSFATYVWHRF